MQYGLDDNQMQISGLAMMSCEGPDGSCELVLSRPPAQHSACLLECFYRSGDYP